jgi:small-conductance mechanosensitive channel
VKAIYEPPVISKARASVRRLLLLCTIGFCGFFVYGASTGGKPWSMGVFTGIVFGLPAATVAWLLLGIIRFAFGLRPR